MKMTNVQGDKAPAKRQNVQQIREFIHEDHWGTIHELAGTAGTSYGVCQEILTENLNGSFIETTRPPTHP
jgi:hypothetical protein